MALPGDPSWGSARLTEVNPYLQRGDIWVEHDTGLSKRGPGYWGELPYWRPFPSVEIDVRDFGATKPGTQATDNTDAFQQALDEAAKVGGEQGAAVVQVPPGEWWVSGLTIGSHVTLQGCGRGSQLVHLGGATTHLLQNLNNTTEQVTIRDINLNGARTLQTEAVDAIHLDSTGGSNTLKRHRVMNVYIQNVKNVGLYAGAFTGSSVFENITVYFCDKYGVQIQGSSTADSTLQNVDIGQSGEHGLLMDSCGGYRVINVKSWFSGRIGLGSAGNGFHIRGVQNSTFDTCVSQENQGWGFIFFGTGAGTPSEGVHAVGLLSDGDNVVGTTFGGIRVGDLRGCTIQGVVGKFATALGTPSVALSMGTGVVGCNLDVAWTDVSGIPVTAGAAGNNNNIRLPRGYTPVTYAAAVTPNIWTTETFKVTLTGDTTLNAPAADIAGQTLTGIFVNDAVGGHVITLNSTYKTNWTPDTTAGAINVISFVCDGADWIQTSATVGI